jgi:hypothetical protein
MALFIESIENSKTFDFMQNLVPVGDRPSILKREKWKKHLKQADDRTLTNKELISSKDRFNEIEFKYYGLLIRLKRLFPNPAFKNVLTTIDTFLTHRYSPFKGLSQKVLVKYKK